MFNRKVVIQVDPLTHAAVGLALAGGSGHLDLSGGLFASLIQSPVSLSCLLGSLLPDGDIIFQIRGDLNYLKAHRGASHSLAVGAGMAGLIALGIFFLHPLGGETPLTLLFFWAMAGILSHLALDTFNSYGAKIFWPMAERRLTLNLLPFFDLIVVALAFWTIFFAQQLLVFLILLAGYLLWRRLMRILAANRVAEYLLALGPMDRLRVLPLASRCGIFQWDFLAESEQAFWVGTVRLGIKAKVAVRRSLLKEPDDPLIRAAMETPLGQFFRSFTPHLYVVREDSGDRAVVRFFDLRYFLGEDFMHRGMAIYKDSRLEDAMFQPYHPGRKIQM